MSETQGRAEPNALRVAVVGGGISGLTAAYTLGKEGRRLGRPVTVRLLDQGDRPGGVMVSERRDGFLIESGPDSFITDKPWALRLTEELGLSGQLIGTNNAMRRAFVVSGGRLLPVPEGFQLLAPSRLWPFALSPIFTWPGKLRMGLDLLIPPRIGGNGAGEPEDESLGSFVQRRLGREALERMAEPMVAGIYGGDPHRLSLRATLPRFLEMERKYGSVIRALWEGTRHRQRGQRGRSGVSGARYGLFATYKEGMQTLSDALLRELPPDALRLRTRVTRLRRTDAPPGEAPHPRWRLTLEGPEGSSEMEADAVCLCLPAHAASRLLAESEPELSGLLAEIQYASAATVNFAYRREDVGHALDGFGFVSPRLEGQSVLGCTFASVKYAGRAPEGHVLLRAFMGEPISEETDEEAIAAAARRDLERLLSITGSPLWWQTARHPKAMAQYYVGHLKRTARIEERVRAARGLALAGNAYRGIGVPDCIHGAQQAARLLLGAE